MSLTTRCPACSTTFKVVPDQLRMSEGWVRCGHCTEVFDASVYLQQADVTPALKPTPQAFVPAPPVAPPPAWAEPAPEPAFEALPADGHGEPEPDAEADAVLDWTPELPPVQAPPPAPELEPEPEPAPEPEPEPEPVMAPEPMHEPAWADADPLQVPVVSAEPVALPEAPPPGIESSEPVEVIELTMPDASAMAAAISSQVEPGARRGSEPFEGYPAEAEADASAAPSDSTLQGMSFVRDARRKAFWRRPGVRAALLASGVMFVLLLGLQVAVHERDRLAALQPAWRPALEALCAPLDCRVAPVRQIESLVIESSSFNKVRGDTYRLSLSIKNRAGLALAMPGVELALTDTQDQPLVRRVLLPADLGAAPVIAAGAEWSASLPVAISGEVAGARIAGYRLLAFYP